MTKLATILAIRGPLTGARISLGKDEHSFGRAPQCDVSIPDSTVSRTHALLRPRGLGWILEDCGSSAGTYLNGKRLEEPAPLSPNDEFRIGHSIFLFDTEFDLQNADFTDNRVYLSGPNDETVALAPVATLDPATHREEPTSPARHGMELLTELGELFDSSRVPFGEALRSTTARMAKMLRAEVALLMLYDHGAHELRASAAVAQGDVLADRSVLRKVFTEGRSLLISDQPELAGHPAPGAPKTPKFRSVAAAPTLVDDTPTGVLYFERHELDAYSLKDLRLVQSLGHLIGVFVEARQKAEALALRVNYQNVDSQVIGGSPNFRKTLEMVRRVAETPATVLIIGETGTGKEVLANEIHRLSPRGREGRPFIAVNCAAIPENLFESELFGHEKGSFTGAHRMHQGYIEQAHGGTLFLDEVGEMTAQVQPKLLRFLQEHTFTRVGGSRMLRAEVRIVAATNRQLEEEVRSGRFREDLYHRINVLPIEVPPLRERREDIRALSEYFAQKYAKSFHKEILGISDDAMIALEKYPWPGNIRELANCIERAVLLCDEKVLLPRHFVLGQGKAPRPNDVKVADTGLGSNRADRSLAEVEKEHILRVLRANDHNQVQAAAVLGIHRNTLRKKLQEYGELT